MTKNNNCIEVKNGKDVTSITPMVFKEMKMWELRNSHSSAFIDCVIDLFLSTTNPVGNFRDCIIVDSEMNTNCKNLMHPKFRITDNVFYKSRLNLITNNPSFTLANTVTRLLRNNLFSQSWIYVYCVDKDEKIGRIYIKKNGHTGKKNKIVISVDMGTETFSWDL